MHNKTKQMETGFECEEEGELVGGRNSVGATNQNRVPLPALDTTKPSQEKSNK